LQNFSVELFLKRAGGGQIGKTPPIMDVAPSDNSTSMSRLNFSRPIPAAQFDIQYIIIDDKLDDVGIFPLVCDRPPAGWLAHHIRSGGIYCVADSAISLCRCICWYPTFVRRIAATRIAIFRLSSRWGPDTKQTSDAIPIETAARACYDLFSV
jgi:hypothetical protein